MGEVAIIRFMQSLGNEMKHKMKMENPPMVIRGYLRSRDRRGRSMEKPQHTVGV